jgi:phosphatidylserine/phosphatidylglycerophosphate/cardiolipin synthase-like enzyme
VDGNSLALLVGGDAFYASLDAAIRAARHEVLLNTYFWADDVTGRAFLEAAAAAARRGVLVAVLVDGVGSFGLNEQQFLSLRQAGAHAAVHGAVRRWLRRSWRLHRLLRRNHRKNCIVDGHLAWTGGAGIADVWTRRCERPWRDVMAVVEGPIAGQFREIFADDWRRATRQSLPPLTPGAAAAPVAAAAAPVAAAAVPVGTAAAPAGGAVIAGAFVERLRVLATSVVHRELVTELHAAMHRARHRVWLASAYFVPSLLLRRRLRAAARRGVVVRLVLQGPDADHRIVWLAGRRHYGRLLAAGVRIFEHRHGVQHAKYALVDDTWGFVGSSNLDAWSARYNLELDLELHSPGAMVQLAGCFEHDALEAHEITHERWRNRPFVTRLADRMLGWVDPLL